MKFGVADYGMSVWEGGNFDLEKRLRDLKAIGFDGIERLEAIDSADLVERAALFRKYGMDFATCRQYQHIVPLGIKWTAATGKEYVWLDIPQKRDIPMSDFCRRANYYVEATKAAGIKTLLHNHLGIRVENQGELDEFMMACPDVYLLLDVGHLFGAGGDVIGTIRKYGKRIRAVHFKDIELVHPEIGLDRWQERLQFRALGMGNVGMDFAAIANALKEVGYDGWVFIEQDHHTDDPLKQLKISFNVLKKIF